MRKKSFKSALTVLLSLMMILVMFPANAFAMDGEGTTADPYIIATVADLYEFAIKVNEGDNTACAVLTADIDMTDEAEWTPIGNDSNQYKGTFDGDGHTITGLKVDIQSDNTIYAGLFGYIGEGGTIKNVSLTDSKITCSGNRVSVGGVCGFNDGTIENCYNTGDVSGTGTSSYGDVYAGGVCGWNTGTIENCYNTGDVSGTTSISATDYVYVGGVCGFNDGTIENCYNTGDVSSTSTDGSGCAGGVCGWNTGTIENCYNTGEVNGASTSTFNPVNAGGVCGLNDYGTIENCYNTGEVSGTGTSSNGTVYAGGVCGWNTGTIQNCYNTRDVSGTSSYGYVYAGGVCGCNVFGTIQNCYNTGDVSSTSTDGSGCAGGVCGLNDYGTIQNCYFLSGITDNAVGNSTGTVNRVEEKSAEAFASGEVTWLLNNGAVDGAQAFYQTCGVGLPQFSGETVYKVKKFKCPYDSIGTDIYSNTNKNVTGEHSYGEPEWNWSEDGKTCKVTFTCENNPEHKETPEVTVTSAVKTPASCTELGITEYTATVVFNGVTYTDTKEIVDIQATGHDFDNGKCTACGEIDPEFKAVIIEGANGEWQKGAKDGLSFTSNAAFAHFLKVQVDGKDLDASDYTVKEGSTIVTLNAEYLETLSVGKHTLAIVSETGTAETEFTITAAPTEDTTTKTETTDTTAKNTSTKSPATGNEASMAAPAVFASICGLAISLILISKKRRNTVK